jgi:hypothetical protein
VDATQVNPNQSGLKLAEGFRLQLAHLEQQISQRLRMTAYYGNYFN